MTSLDTTLAAVNGALNQPVIPEKISEFLARLDAALAKLPDDRARRKMLRQQSDHWSNLYGRFVQAVDMGGDPPGDAFDYMITIANIDARLGRYALERS